MSTTIEQLKTLGRYQISRPLGRGGMGIVYLAQDTELARDVAIKCFSLDANQRDLTTRLKQEAVLLAKLNHPNVIQLYDVVEDNETLGLVMEFADGTTLRQTLKEQPPTLHTALSYLAQIANGLQQAHKAGIIHCDLKLDNILMAGQTPKISDFGIAQARRDHADQPRTNSQQVTGSSYSASPEQAQGLPLDFRTDVFSFGVLAYQVLSGRHPFGKTLDQREMLERIVNQRFELNTVDRHNWPIALQALITELLEKQPQNRPSNMAKVAQQLQEIQRSLDGENEIDDATAIIQAVSAKPAKTTRRWLAGGMIGSIILAASIGLIMLQPSNQKMLSVAVLAPNFSHSNNNFDTSRQRRIVATIKTSLEESLLRSDTLRLNPNSDIDVFEGNFVKFANAIAADYIIRPSADCQQQRCQIVLQKLSGASGLVEQQLDWPVVATSMSDIRETIATQFPSLFPNLKSVFEQPAVGEESYQRYLDLYLTTPNDSDDALAQLKELEDLQLEAAKFLPLYKLYSRRALDLFDRTGDNKILNRLNVFLSRAPTLLREQPTFKQLEFRHLLKTRDFLGAESVVAWMGAKNADRVLVNDLQALLAWEKDNYDDALALERESVLLQPSYTRFYNLAVSEYTLGNLEQAREAAKRTLELVPQDIDALNLIAAIELTNGNLDDAARLYRELVVQSPDSYGYLNLGVTLMLQGQFDESIHYIQMATDLNPGNPEYQLNLADAHLLAGQLQAANKAYQRVIDNTATLDGATQFYFRAQAQAHLGDFNQAIKTLRLAEQTYSATPESAYAAALVHALAGNNSAAIVETENAINGGIGAVWFHLSWFNRLCDSELFVTLVQHGDKNPCRGDPN
ncbi:serine/threonine-protein kinase [Arenicella xantha]|uniref:Serine/threonine-protein kinase n=1 Tax=Arenicella xantha TaxID=644221 RepID=A0A395JNX1_9GAMM|nr:serine/threonine-protein kinase [Arenicella xantha]RBP51278.1 serine/threonine-protein kinase [Arenicella xantha]